MALISWGKPRIFVYDADAATPSAYELATPVEDSTELGSNKGDRMEAPIEGGELEDVRYKRNTYTLAYNIRKAKGRKAPFPAVDGIVDHHYGVIVIPEDPTCEGFIIESSTVGIDDTFTAADGAIWAIQHDAIKPASGDTVKWGTIAIANNNLTFTERSSVEDGGTAYTKTIAISDAANTNGAAGAVQYTAVSSPSGNPSTKGYYELVNGSYVATSDTTVQSGKTYYELAS